MAGLQAHFLSGFAFSVALTSPAVVRIPLPVPGYSCPAELEGREGGRFS